MNQRPTEVLQAILENVEKVVVGKRAELELTIIALAGQGHVLIEDVPGVGKTMMAKALARLLLQAHSVHARSAAKRRDGRVDFQPAKLRVRVSTGASRRAGRAGG